MYPDSSRTTGAPATMCDISRQPQLKRNTHDTLPPKGGVLPIQMGSRYHEDMHHDSTLPARCVDLHGSTPRAGHTLEPDRVWLRCACIWLDVLPYQSNVAHCGSPSTRL